MKRRFQVIVGFILSAFLLCGLAYAVGLRLNTTPSIPVGVYQLTHDALTKGAYVYFCPPRSPVFEMAKERGYISAGFCPGGYGHLMKKILATQNDVVTIGKAGVQINGQLLPLSIPLRADGAGRLLPKYVVSKTLDSAEVLFMADNNDYSFDGRYFGAIKREQIEGVIRPVLTW
jgi:conjugative transfer signal peptidase TraF